MENNASGPLGQPPLKPAREIAAEHIRLLTGSADTPMCFRALRGEDGRNIDGTLAECWPVLERLNLDGWQVYFVVNEGGHVGLDITRIRALWVDADGDPLPKDWHLWPSFLVRRDATHWHAYWLAQDIPVSEFRTAQRRLIQHYDTDAGIKDLPRIMRLAGSLHLKDPNNPILVTVEELDMWLGPRDLATLMTGLADIAEETQAELDQDLVASNQDDVIAALAQIPNDDRHWENWNTIGMAFFNATEGEGLDAWLVFSAKSNKYDEGVAQGRWDYWGSGHEATRIGAAKIFALAKEADPNWIRPSFVHDPAARLAKMLPPPRDLFGMLTPEPVLTRDMLPKVIADFAFDQAERMGVVPAMIAMPAIVASAACLHDGFTIAPKNLDRSFTQSARLWACLVCGVSDLKTPAVNAAVGPVWEIHLERAAAYKQKFAQYKIDHAGWKGANGDLAALGKQTPEPEAPIKSKLIASDPTMESVAAILADNPQGILIHRDELAGWVGSFGAYQTQGSGKDRTLALELYNGGPKTFDRRGGDIDVSNWSASIIGTIQLAKLREMAPKLEDDGFLQRFIVVPGGRVSTGDVDREPNYAADSAYRTLVRRLVELDPGENCPSVRLSGDARPYWNEVTALGHALADMPGVPSALVGFLNKITGNFARLLLAFHAVTQTANNAKIEDDVSGDTARRARDLVVRFIFPAVERVYAECFLPNDEGLQAVRWIAGHILAHKVERLTDRDFYRAAHHKKGLGHPEDDKWARKQAMEVLVAAGWAYPDGDTAWTIDKRVHEVFVELAQAERSRRDATIERIKRAGEAMKKSYGENH